MSSDKKIVLITGASSGFGKVTANLLQEKGFRVFGTSRKPTPEKFEMLQLDVNSDDSVKSCVTSLLEKTGGKIDVLMNNAGFVQMGGIEEVSLEEAKLKLETNLWGYVRMAKAVLPGMRQQKSGRIINIGSLGGIVSVPFMGYYSISKFALEAFAEALRQEVRSFGIWVSIVEPVFFKTNIYASSKNTSNKISDYDGTRKRVYTNLRKRDRTGKDPVEVAKIVLKIIEDPRPGLHYPVGINKSTLWLMKLLPKSTVENQTRRMFDVDG